jgi:thiol-disulfide isomerase/thioredoxin
MVAWLVLLGCRAPGTAVAAEAETLSYEATGCDGWSRAGNVLGGGALNDAVVLPDGRVFLVGSSPKSAQIFDPRTREIAPTAKGPWQFLTGGQGVVLDDDELLLVGGEYVRPLPDKGRSITEAVCFVLDWSADKWKPIACPSLWRAHVEARPRVARLADGSILAFDGVHGIAEFHASTREWTNEARAPRVLPWSSIVGLDHHRLLVLGGSRHAFVYDADARTWTAASPPPIHVGGSDLFLLPDDHLLAVAGGSTAIYDASSDVWVLGPSTTTTRSQPGVAMLDDGSILIAGGWDGNMRRVPFAEILRPGSSAWELAGTNCIASRFPVLVDTVAGPFLFGGLEADGARESSTSFSFSMRQTVRIEHWDLTPEDLPTALALPPRTLAPLEPGTSSRAPHAWVGEQFPDLEVEVAGTGRRVSSWTGVRVVDVWATWCPPCLKALPVLDDAARRWEARGVSIVLVSVDDDVEKIKDFDSGIHHATVAWSRDASNELGLGGIPATFVLDAKGRVLAQHAGGVDLRKWLDDQLSKATQ